MSNKGKINKLINNGSVTSIYIDTQWTDDYDPVVVDVQFDTHEQAFQFLHAFANILKLNEQVVWRDGEAMRQTNRQQTQGEYHAYTNR